MKLLLAPLALSLTIAAASAPAAKPSPKPAASRPEAGGRNLKVLKGWSHERIDSAMGFFAASLGVGCDHCHVRTADRKWDMASDEMPEKATARRMIEMTRALNEKWFAGGPRVTCATCHDGRAEPGRVPPVDAVVAGAERERAKPAQPAEKPTVAELLRRYVEASGGEAAWKAASSRVERGTVVHANRRGEETSKQVNARRAPASLDQRMSRDGKELQRVWTDGASAWFGREGRSEPLEADSAVSFKRDATFALPLALAARGDLKLDGREKFHGGDAWVVTGHPDDKTKERWFFGDDGQLRAVYRESDSEFGPMPEMIRFEDYRPVGALKLPFVIRASDPWDRATVTFEEITLDEPVAAGAFAPPPPEPAETH